MKIHAFPCWQAHKRCCFVYVVDKLSGHVVRELHTLDNMGNISLLVGIFIISLLGNSNC